ncbi:hypothetical protein EUGRSUZ_E03430 [Eucalyptus grandis]|uniref:Uncharacterized protein n=2 Tax=Eucalyptus grandis TaxID=71139 RepID=A0ACC3KZF5_EUCGR|nr:hypothetical protein EUGRSUZ_E03430 [Eucalyptus grandis]
MCTNLRFFRVLTQSFMKCIIQCIELEEATISLKDSWKYKCWIMVIGFIYHKRTSLLVEVVIKKKKRL